LIDEDLGGAAQIVLTAHQSLPGTSRVIGLCTRRTLERSGFAERSIAQLGGAR